MPAHIIASVIIHSLGGERVKRKNSRVSQIAGARRRIGGIHRNAVTVGHAPLSDATNSQPPASRMPQA